MTPKPNSALIKNKWELLAWLRRCRERSQASPSDRTIMQHLKLRNTDEALALVQSLADDDLIEIEQLGNIRIIRLCGNTPVPETPKLSRETIEAIKQANPPAPSEPRPVRSDPAPIVIPPEPRPLFAPLPAPIGASTPKPEEETMPTAVHPSRPQRPQRHSVTITPLKEDFNAIARRASEAGQQPGPWALTAVLAALRRGAAPAAQGKLRIPGDVTAAAVAAGEPVLDFACRLMLLGLGALDQRNMSQ